MKLFSDSYTLAFALLLAGQVSQALPTDSSSIVTRADAESSPLYGLSEKPEFKDLVDANNFNSTQHFNVDLDQYTNILLGFVKCQPTWVKSWFSTAAEFNNYNEEGLDPLKSWFMLRYDQEDDKRRAFAVARGWVVAEYLDPTDERSPLLEGAGWPWALLEGAYNGKKDDRDMKSIVMALAGEELKSISNSVADDYWTILKEAHRSPMSVKYDGLWYTVMFTTGEGPADGSVTLGRVDWLGYKERAEPVSMDQGKIEEIKYLLGTPDFGNGKRKGDLVF